MPEKPEIQTIADWLVIQLVGKTLHGIEYNDKGRYAKTGITNHDQLDQLLPMQITEISTKGKKIVFLLTNDETGEEAFVISSLMMEGKWLWEPDNHSDLWFVIGDDKKPFYLSDSRHFATLEIILTEADLLERMSEIGPDLLLDEISFEQYRAKIKAIGNNKRLRKPKKVGIFLMEQEHFSGVGNYLRAEILYASRISPHRELKDLSDDEIKRLLNHSRDIIKKSYQAQGATIATYRSPHGGKGDFEVVVYGKTKDPLGHDVVAEDIGDKRTTHWVPAIQK